MSICIYVCPLFGDVSTAKAAVFRCQSSASVQRMARCIDEYKSFKSLPSGRDIAYSDRITQLLTPTINFAKAETQILFLQPLVNAVCLIVF